MNRILKTGLAGLCLAVNSAFGQGSEAVPPMWEVVPEGGVLQQVPFSPKPVRIPTAGGNLVFQPNELVRVEFPMMDQCVVTTIYGDRWVVAAKPQILLGLVEGGELKTVWNTVNSVTFLSSSQPPEPVAAPWKVELQNGSTLNLIPDGATVAIQTASGKINLPLGMLQGVETGAPGTIELSPGGHAMKGLVAESSLLGRDLGGRQISMPWKTVARFSRPERMAPDSIRFEQDVLVRGKEGEEESWKIPVLVFTLEGRGGSWLLPSCRISRIQNNRDGTHSIQTTVGEWLTGSIRPQEIPVLKEAGEVKALISDCMSMRWDNNPVEMPTNSLVWRLTTGDLLVGEWKDDSVEVSDGPGNLLRVRNSASTTDIRLPVQTNGKWPVAAFLLRHGPDGELLKVPSAWVEAVRPGPVSQMPPALVATGPSAVWSDEILLPGGSFLMGRTRGEGADDEVPPVELFLEPFWLASTPVTVSQFAVFANATRLVTDAEKVPSGPSWRAPGFPQRPDDPVVCVSWRDAVRYCNWRSTMAKLAPCYEISRDGREIVFHPDRNGYRLPLEVEREYAARSGGLDLTFPWGEESDIETVVALANFQYSGTGMDPWPWTNPVKAFSPSRAGFYGMGGNVWEWCQDIYRADAYSGALRGEGLESWLNATPGRDERRVMRGGSFNNGVEYLRCSARGFGIERMSASRIGFRLARNDQVGVPEKASARPRYRFN